MLYPGEGTFQHRAILAGAGRKLAGRATARGGAQEALEELVEQARHNGRTVISSEFSTTSTATAGAMIGDLGGAQRVSVAVTFDPSARSSLGLAAAAQGRLHRAVQPVPQDGLR